MNKKHIYMSLLLIVTFLLSGCPEVKVDPGSLKDLFGGATVSKSMAPLSDATKMPEGTPAQRAAKQKAIKEKLKDFKLTVVGDYQVKNKKELVVLVTAEVWAQGTGGNKKWDVALNKIDTSLIEDMSYLFSAAAKKGYKLELFEGDISDWDVGSVTDTSHMFSGATKFNTPLDEWALDSVEKMASMFDGATLFDQDLADWDEHLKTANKSGYRTITKADMFKGSPMEAKKPAWLAKIKEPTASAGGASAGGASAGGASAGGASAGGAQLTKILVTAVDKLLKGTSLKRTKQAEIQKALANAKKSMQLLSLPYEHYPSTKDELVTIIKAETLAQGTGGAEKWDADLNQIDTSKIRDMAYLFSNDRSDGKELHDFNGLINEWDVSSVTTFRSMFDGATSFDQNLNDWDEHLKNADKTKYRKVQVQDMFKGSPMETKKPAWHAAILALP